MMKTLGCVGLLVIGLGLGCSQATDEVVEGGDGALSTEGCEDKQRRDLEEGQRDCELSAARECTERRAFDAWKAVNKELEVGHSLVWRQIEPISGSCRRSVDA